MAGIYIHIPFCKTRCIYCDFFSSAKKKGMAQYVTDLCKELSKRKSYLENKRIETIYLGGGTPSLLPASGLEKIFDEIKNIFECDWNSMEITLEANPDDITKDYLNTIKNLPFNRISIGVQSFNDEELKFLNRRHDARSARKAVKLCKAFGFENISIDLMYGLPDQSMKNWKKSIWQTVDLNIQHISAYHLIYEEKTRLHRLLTIGKIHPVDDDRSLQMFEKLIDESADAGFEQYEISNFAKQGCRSIHNSSYWNGKHYLGIGASAHSFNGISRQWNRASFDYLKSEPEMEIIDEKTAYNEFIITRLRTMKGINLPELETLFGEEKTNHIRKQSRIYIQKNQMEIRDSHLRLTRSGIFVSDGMMRDLMI
ncbi:MAG: radical SAM family heme chaperone HemW [Dysgonamonadaceae bacterium]|jgi:oxygen-independent coproporphyrinogen-3 oxidase|nr:radical SAM family heme chaperone HemW [Dysgonamonadaceae bacterium]